jgi:hypothetical protein
VLLAVNDCWIAGRGEQGEFKKIHNRRNLWTSEGYNMPEDLY